MKEKKYISVHTFLVATGKGFMNRVKLNLLEVATLGAIKDLQKVTHGKRVES